MNLTHNPVLSEMLENLKKPVHKFSESAGPDPVPAAKADSLNVPAFKPGTATIDPVPAGRIR